MWKGHELDGYPIAPSPTPATHYLTDWLRPIALFGAGMAGGGEKGGGCGDFDIDRTRAVTKTPFL